MIPQTWFRFYNEVVDDPKVQRLSPNLFKAWINFMCIASKYGGALPSIKDVAYRLRITPIRAEVLLDELVKAALFEWVEGVAIPHNWHGRQFKSDGSTERVKRFRNGLRNVAETVTETAPTEQNRTEQNIPPIVPKDGLKYSAEFEIFWTSYPRKTGKGAAWKVWKKLKPSQPLQDSILKAVSDQKTGDQTAGNTFHTRQPGSMSVDGRMRLRRSHTRRLRLTAIARGSRIEARIQNRDEREGNPQGFGLQGRIALALRNGHSTRGVNRLADA